MVPNHLPFALNPPLISLDSFGTVSETKLSLERILGQSFFVTISCDKCVKVLASFILKRIQVLKRHIKKPKWSLFFRPPCNPLTSRPQMLRGRRRKLKTPPASGVPGPMSNEPPWRFDNGRSSGFRSGTLSGIFLGGMVPKKGPVCRTELEEGFWSLNFEDMG